MCPGSGGTQGTLCLLPNLQSLSLLLLLHVHLIPHLGLLSHLTPQPLLLLGAVQGNWAYPVTQHQGPGAGRQHPTGPPLPSALPGALVTSFHLQSPLPVEEEIQALSRVPVVILGSGRLPTFSNSGGTACGM